MKKQWIWISYLRRLGLPRELVTVVAVVGLEVVPDPHLDVNGRFFESLNAFDASQLLDVFSGNVQDLVAHFQPSRPSTLCPGSRRSFSATLDEKPSDGFVRVGSAVETKPKTQFFTGQLVNDNVLLDWANDVAWRRRSVKTRQPILEKQTNMFFFFDFERFGDQHKNQKFRYLQTVSNLNKGGKVFLVLVF